MLVKTFEKSFRDKRLDERGNDIIRSLFINGTHSIRQFSFSSAAQKGNYRFLENEQTKEDTIVKSMSDRCGSAVKGKVVLSIQDTSEINLYNHKNRIRHDHSIGVTNAPKNGLGYMLHPSLVVDAVDCFPYGFSHVHLFNRDLEREPKESRDKHGYKKLDIEDKESNKWLLSCNAAKESLQQAAMVIIVQDREGDIYEQFATIPDERTHLLIRAKSDRSLPEGKKLFSKVSACDVAGTYHFEIEGDKRKGQKKRTAQMEVRFTNVEIKNPSRTAKDAAPKVKLYCVEAQESASTQEEHRVCWRILTSLPVTTLDEALMVVEWYSWRWMIEEVFRILKKEGFDIEASELEYGSSIRKLCLLMLDAIIKIFQMKIVYETDEEGVMPASLCFEETELECMEMQCKRLEGSTQKQKNPYKRRSLRYATWIIARLGGWKGYASERKPGITTLWIGLEKFYNTFNGYMLLKDVSTR
jgi:Transposase DDE domain/Transposase DNA-binding